MLVFRKWWSGYGLTAYLYMLQQVEYSGSAFCRWYYEAKSFVGIEKRAKLKWTVKIKILTTLTVVCAIILLPLTLIFMPIVLPVVLLGWNTVFNLVTRPVVGFIMRKTRGILENHSARKIVVLGSYGKTTAKEIFTTVLGEGTKATHGNENTLMGIARFAEELSGDEKVLILELGEFKFGDIRRLAKMIRPDYAVFTGVGNAHLETLKDTDGVMKTLNEVREFVLKSHVAVNADNAILRQQPAEWYFSKNGVNGKKISNLQLAQDGTKFEFMGMKIKSPLLGKHNVAAVAFAVFFAREIRHMENKMILENLKKLKAVPHRMEPRWVNGSLIIDDTYNGNLEGVRAGLELIRNLGFVHKVYVTPGLVEQGEENQETHVEIGKLIAGSGVEKVYLMHNSVVGFIKSGLKKAGFRGEAVVVENPLDFYENIETIAIPGQVIMMQNDWGDNYL